MLFSSLPGAAHMISHIHEPGSPGFLRIGPSLTTGRPTPKITLLVNCQTRSRVFVRFSIQISED
jgi:hypothetical protein